MSIVFDPSRSISGVRRGASSVRYKPIDARIDLGTPGRFEVHLDDEVGPRFAAATDTAPDRRFAWRPAEKMPIRKTRAGNVHPGKARRDSFASKRRTSPVSSRRMRAW